MARCIAYHVIKKRRVPRRVQTRVVFFGPACVIHEPSPLAQQWLQAVITCHLTSKDQKKDSKMAYVTPRSNMKYGNEERKKEKRTQRTIQKKKKTKRAEEDLEEMG